MLRPYLLYGAAAMRVLGAALVAAGIVLVVLAESTLAQTDRLDDLPVVTIDAPEGIVDSPKRDATMRVIGRDGREDSSGPIGIEMRGGTSQSNSPKKSYGIETRKRSGENRNVSLLGMPADDDWVLIASPVDESLLRSYVAYSTARWLGRYAARTRLVEVTVNDSYDGIYLLAEQLKVHEDRVAVDDTDISGGYLLETTSMHRLGVTPQDEEFFTTPVQNRPVIYTDPERDELSLARANWIRGYVNRCERRLYRERFTSRRRGYRSCLDMDAAVDYLLLSELYSHDNTFKDQTFMHKGVGGKLVLGPVWDYDNAIGSNGLAEFNLRKGWKYRDYPWAGRLYDDPALRGRMATRWRELRRRGLRRHMMRTIDRAARKLARGPQQRNFSRWPAFEDEHGPVDPRTGAPPESYAQAVSYLKWWLKGRIKWINRHVNSLSPDRDR